MYDTDAPIDPALLAYYQQAGAPAVIPGQVSPVDQAIPSPAQHFDRLGASQGDEVALPASPAGPIGSPGDYFSGPGATPPPPPPPAGPPPIASPAQYFGGAGNPIAQVAKQEAQAQGEQEQVIRAQGEEDAAKAADEAEIIRRRNIAQDAQRQKNEEAEAAHAADLQSRAASIDAATDANSKIKIDPDRYWKEGSTAGNIANTIGILLSGIGMARAGHPGENPALEILKGKIKDDVAAQMANRDQANQTVNLQKDSLNTYTKLFHDQDAAAAAKLIEGYKVAADKIELTAAQHASPQVKLNAARAVADLHREIAKGTQAIAKWQQERDDKKQELANQTAQVGIAGGHLALARKMFDWSKIKDMSEFEIKAAELAAKEGKLPADQQKLVVGGIPTPIKDEQGNTVDVTFKPLQNKDGGATLYFTEDEAKAGRKVKTGVDTANRLVNTIVNGIAEHGGASGFLQSKEWQTIQANKESLLFALHEAEGIESFRPGTLEPIEKLLGGSDPASFLHDATPGLLTARDNLNAQFTDALHNHSNYDGGIYAPADTTKKPAGAADEADFKRMLGPVSVSEFGTPAAGNGNPVEAAAGTIANFAAAGGENAVLPAVESKIRELGKAAISPDINKHRAAVAQLRQLSSDAQSQGVRKLADSVLKATLTLHAPGDAKTASAEKP